MSTRCINQVTIRPNQDDEMKVACGYCPGCVKRRVSNWSFRLSKQAEVSTSALFVTLTYDTDHIPITPNGFMTLNKKDLQNYFKRLRKSYTDGRKIKYYACGEYGGRTKRPHYHIILFNADHANIAQAWQLEGKLIGHYHIGTCTPASIGYTLKYISKQRTVGKHHRDDRQYEFSLMSKGLGANYLTEKMIAWHKADLLERCYCPMKDGAKASMARYYKDRIYTKEEMEAIAWHHYQKAQEEADQETMTEEERKQFVKYQIEKMHSYATENRSTV